RLGVAQVEDLTAGIAHRIVGPRREPIEEAVLRPCTSPAPLRYAEAGARIRNDVRPRRGRGIRCGDTNLVISVSRDPSGVSRDRRASGTVCVGGERWLPFRPIDERLAF